MMSTTWFADALAARMPARPTLLASTDGSLAVGIKNRPAALGSDEELVARAQRGDRQAFDDLYRRYADLVWGRLGRLIGPDPEREDLVQQIFLELFRGLSRFRGDASFRTFLYRVVVNTAADHLKRRKRRPQSVSIEEIALVPGGDDGPETRAEHRQRLSITLDLLDRIKPKKRIAFLLRVVEGLSLEEIAELCQASPATVAQRIRHAHLEIDRLVARSSRREA